MIRSLAIACALLSMGVGQAASQTPTDQLAQPPENAQAWSIISSAGPHGRSHRWTSADGTRWSRESILLRGFVTEVDQQMRIVDGDVASFEVRGVTPSGDAAERYARTGASYRFQSPVDRGEGAAAGYYTPFGGTIDGTAALTDALLAAPGRSLNMLPSGQARIEELTTLEVAVGGERKTLTAYAVSGLGLSPFPIWYEGDRFFGVAGFLSWMPVGWESVATALTQAQERALSGRSAELVARVAPRASLPVVFEGVRIYDAERRQFVENMTVLVENGRISAVGRDLAQPAQAIVYQGAGRTLVPGLWDNHQHYGSDDTGPLLLSQGVTSVRDPGNNPETAPARWRRIADSEVLGTRIVASMLIDGVGPNTAQTALAVGTRAEAIAAVQRAQREGYAGVKLYGSLDPAWLRPMAREAHRLGLRVHGHIPRGMRPLEAVRGGYDEITHINWVMMQVVPDSVIEQSNGLQRFYGPALYGPRADWRAPRLNAYLDELARRGIAVDPTLSTFEPLYVPDAGELAAGYEPFAGTLPPQVERGLRAGGLLPNDEVSRAQMREGFESMVALVGELHRRGVTIVAGTDGSGLELVRELELYVQAGMTPGEALATATIVPAREFGVGEETGAIAAGRLAELVLVDGDVSRDIGALRNVVAVMRDGRLMQAAALREAVGIAGPPRRP